MASDYSIVFITVPDKPEKEDKPDVKVADSLSRRLVESRLAGCVNIIPNVASVYRWEGKVRKENELLLIVKTKTGLVPRLVEFVKKNHPYKVPEVVALPILVGNPQYLDWVGASTEFVQPLKLEVG